MVTPPKNMQQCRVPCHPVATLPTTLNLPPFREDQPAMWFTLAEGQFEMKGMQDRRH